MYFKIFESVIVDQLSSDFDNCFSPLLSGFRKNHNCEHVLYNFTENCKSVLDNNEIGCAVLTDLSKAFDCLPHNLLIAKFNAYGLDKSACKLIANYFMDRKQCVKIANSRSAWQLICKGAAQGSLFGPFTFNVLISDLLNIIKDLCEIYNYADDNTICCRGATFKEAHDKTQNTIRIMMDWLKANPDKFQFIVFEQKYQERKLSVDNILLSSQKSVKLLGLHIDNALKFNCHITELCKKAGRKINVLARLSTHLDVGCKLTLFYSFILSHFQYCSSIWMNCGDMDTRKIENIQKRALRYIYRDFTSCYTTLRNNDDIPLMYVHRIRHLMMEVYKILNKLSPSYLCDMFSLTDSKYDMRNVLRLKLPKYNNVRHGKKTIKFQGAHKWNALPNDIKESESINMFKRRIAKWSLQCNYHNCILCKINILQCYVQQIC